MGELRKSPWEKQAGSGLGRIAACTCCHAVRVEELNVDERFKRVKHNRAGCCRSAARYKRAG